MNKEEAEKVVRELLPAYARSRFDFLIQIVEDDRLPKYLFKEYNEELKDLLESHGIQLLCRYDKNEQFKSLGLIVTYGGRSIVESEKG